MPRLLITVERLECTSDCLRMVTFARLADSRLVDSSRDTPLAVEIDRVVAMLIGGRLSASTMAVTEQQQQRRRRHLAGVAQLTVELIDRLRGTERPRQCSDAPRGPPGGDRSFRWLLVASERT